MIPDAACRLHGVPVLSCTQNLYLDRIIVEVVICATTNKGNFGTADESNGIYFLVLHRYMSFPKEERYANVGRCLPRRKITKRYCSRRARLAPFMLAVGHCALRADPVIDRCVV